MTIQMPTVIVDSGASVDDREDSMQMLRDQIYAQQCEINALRKALMYAHPAKTLTDEDYMILGLRFMQWNREQKEPLVKLAYEQYVFEQAIAILRKAQEK